MTPDQLTLARAVVALPGWEWRPGMRWLDPGATVLTLGWVRSPVLVPSGAVPDLQNDATGGCLLAMLATPGTVTVFYDVDRDVPGGPWGVATGQDHASLGSTLAEACARCALARGRWA